jgi:hypothetical protein
MFGLLFSAGSDDALACSAESTPCCLLTISTELGFGRVCDFRAFAVDSVFLAQDQYMRATIHGVGNIGLFTGFCADCGCVRQLFVLKQRLTKDKLREFVAGEFIQHRRFRQRVITRQWGWPCETPLAQTPLCTPTNSVLVLFASRLEGRREFQCR